MTVPDTLYLHEEILLLATHDRAGTVVSGGWHAQALAGAILSDLMLLNRIQLVEGGDLEVVNTDPIGEPVLDECLERLAQSSKPKSMRKWLSTLSNWKDLKHRVAEGLCERGILRCDKDRVLLFFERRVYPEVNPEPERALIDRLWDAIESDDQEVDARTVAILSLAYHTNILKEVFGRKELKARKDRIEAIIEGEAMGEAAKEVLAALQMAIVVSACIVPIIAS